MANPLNYASIVTALLPALVGSGKTKTTNTVAPGQLADVNALLASLTSNQAGGRFSKEAAIKDSEGAVNNLIKRSLEANMPNVLAGGVGSGLRADTTTALLSNDLQARISEQSQKLILDTIQNYAGIQQGALKAASGAARETTGSSVSSNEGILGNQLAGAGVAVAAALLPTVLSSLGVGKGGGGGGSLPEFNPLGLNTSQIGINIVDAINGGQRRLFSNGASTTYDTESLNPFNGGSWDFVNNAPVTGEVGQYDTGAAMPSIDATFGAADSQYYGAAGTAPAGDQSGGDSVISTIGSALGSVICTALADKKILTRSQYSKLSAIFQIYKASHPNVIKGYYKWGLPLANYISHNRFGHTLLELIFAKVAKDIIRYYHYEEFNLAGWAIFNLIVPFNSYLATRG